METAVDLDRLVDYRREYTAVLQHCKCSGGGATARCPFHDDKNNSFSVDFATGQWKCFAEGIGGNYISFRAKLDRVSNKEAYNSILDAYHVRRDKKQKPEPSGLEPYSLAQYAFEKRLPERFLAEVCGLCDARDRKEGGVAWLKIPYKNVEGQVTTYRKRYAHKEFRWRMGSAGKIGLYGEWRLPEFREKGYVVLVEGESDTQSLWYMGIPAVGVPGASMFKPEQAALLQDFRVYLHQEPDKGGETFVAKVSAGLREGGFLGEVYLWSCRQLGQKDPSDVYLEYGQQEAAERIQAALKGAEPIDLTREAIPEAISGAPVNLRQPQGWIYSDQGISQIDEKRFAPTVICKTPIILTRRLQSMETGEEKMVVAFKRDGRWQSATYPRSTIFQSKSITVLADLGCTITSENAKKVVSFLGALEAENIDIIPRVEAASTFGWQPGRRFIPGHSDGIELDIDPSQRATAAAYCQNGTLEGWVQAMAPHRGRHRFRFILAASFAAPLLRIVKQRIFFVYNWGGSKGGKTAALKAALSAWGDPERLMVNFNATQVGLERTAAFYCDLPLGIDERQLAGDNQGALEKIVYMIASGTGKIRGAKGGGLQATRQWRTVALATGEEPLSTETSQTGVSTRVLELYGGPFDSEEEASRMHQQAAEDCGWAGPAFVGRLIQADERDIAAAFERMQQHVHAVSGGRSSSHIAGIATVALADAMVDSWFFQPQGATDDRDCLGRLGILPQSWEAARRMAEDILTEQVADNSADVNENAVQFVVDWVLSNQASFGVRTVGPCFGFTSESGNTAYIYPSVLNRALKDAHYSPRKTLKYMADRGLIATYTDKNGTLYYSIMRRFNNRSQRFVAFYIGKLAEAQDPVEQDEEDEPLPEGWGAAAQTSMEEEGDSELPF